MLKAFVEANLKCESGGNLKLIFHSSVFLQISTRFLELYTLLKLRTCKNRHIFLFIDGVEVVKKKL